MFSRRGFVQSSLLVTIMSAASQGYLIGNAAAQNAGADLPDSVRPLLDPQLKSNVIFVKDVGTTTYYVVAQFDDAGGGEPVFIREPQDGEPIIIEDIRSLPVEVLLDSPGNKAGGASSVDFEIGLYGLSDLDLLVNESGGDRAASPDIDKRMNEGAVKNLKMPSGNAAGTNHGRLACAWAVNRVTELSLGRPIGGGLATANMIKVLKARHELVPEKSIVPGAVVISPTIYSTGRANIGHVGIVGEGGKIYSNSSNKAEWQQNFTVDAWKSHYGGKGLQVLFFRLDADYFG
jgi:hypothetical protein